MLNIRIDVMDQDVHDIVSCVHIGSVNKKIKERNIIKR